MMCALLYGARVARPRGMAWVRAIRGNGRIAPPVGTCSAAAMKHIHSTREARACVSQLHDVREAFLSYFEKQHGHVRLPSSPCVPPPHEGSLLFTSAGMVQFKHRMLPVKQSDGSLYVDSNAPGRVVTAQKCVRAGGKDMCDLAEVGSSRRHHTFFEMLGNFGFNGAYWKRESISMAWNFLTRELRLPEDRLLVTVHADDAESAAVWQEDHGVRAFPCGDEHNMCDPLVRGNPAERADCLEIWNLVFVDKVRGVNVGEYDSLPFTTVDTGAGLERLCSVMQDVDSNYDIDSIRSIIAAIERRCASSSTKYSSSFGSATEALPDRHFRIIADHARTITFLLADGVLPGGTGRGHVLRRLIRRCIVSASALGIEGPFLCDVVGKVVEVYGGVYGELKESQSHIESVVRGEEAIFSRAYCAGLRVLESLLQDRSFLEERGGEAWANPEAVFQLHDAHGLPVEASVEVLREKGISVDVEAVKLLEEQHKARSTVSSSDGEVILSDAPSDGPPVQALKRIVGNVDQEYNAHELTAVTANVRRVVTLHKTYAVISPCPFYARGGGQEGDRGVLHMGDTSVRVADCFPVKTDGGNVVRVLELEGRAELAEGADVGAAVDEDHRKQCSIHHTATHLLHAALRSVLPEENSVRPCQAGSDVTSQRLRFDFTYPRALTEAELTKIEERVASVCRRNIAVETDTMELLVAKQSGALFLPGEEYDDAAVRVVSIGESGQESRELCGGTHADTTLEVLPFVILREASSSAGVRRIEACCGPVAEEFLRDRWAVLDSAWGSLRNTKVNRTQINSDELHSKVAVLQTEVRKRSDEANSLRLNLAEKTASSTRGVYQGHEVVLHSLNVCGDVSVDQLKAVARRMLSKSEDSSAAAHVVVCGQHVVCLSSEAAGTTPAFHAGKSLREMLAAVEGRGGGNAQVAAGRIGEGFDGADFENVLMSAS